MRIIGMDIHRNFAEVAALDEGVIKRLGRIGLTRQHLHDFAGTLLPTDHIVVEATGNATAVTDIIAPHVARVAVANPLQCTSSPKPRSKPTPSMRACWRSSMQQAFCRKSGFPTRRLWRAVGK